MNTMPAHSAQSPAHRQRRSKGSQPRAAAKIGMSISLGALVATGLLPGVRSRHLHIWSGLALVGFSIWHHSLYQPRTGKN
jgi:hypothetical protein